MLIYQHVTEDISTEESAVIQRGTCPPAVSKEEQMAQMSSPNDS